jgi:hypothetical protein
VLDFVALFGHIPKAQEATFTLFRIPKYDAFRQGSTTQCDGFVHERALAAIRQLPSGHWQVQIRLKGRRASETFFRHDHAREWATEAEAQIGRGFSPSRDAPHANSA